MSIDTRMNYASMERMQRAFEQAARTIEDTARKMQQIERQMEGGALQGEAGDAFRDALRSKLAPRLNVLRDKMAELAKDIHGAVIAKRDGVATAQSRFK